MTTGSKQGGALSAAIAAALLCGGTMIGGALADGTTGGSVKDAPKDEGRKLTWSWNLGVSSDYIFRGVSQNNRKPAAQGGVDMTYGIFYAGVWGSDVNFGRNFDGAPFGSGNPGSAVANVEIDYYAGIKPVLGPVTFDIGVIQYTYLGGHDKGPRFLQVREQDYTELKLGASGTFLPKLTTGVTAFLSPQYTGGQGFVTTVEGSVAYELPTTLRMTPTVSALVGGVFGDSNDAKDPFVVANGKDSYIYWNAGLTLGIDKLSIDFRYWDTNIPNSGRVLANNFCSQSLFGCDGRFVATAKVTF
jgi:uncharacterized protein (TIGR02001 family)